MLPTYVNIYTLWLTRQGRLVARCAPVPAALPGGLDQGAGPKGSRAPFHGALERAARRDDAGHRGEEWVCREHGGAGYSARDLPWHVHPGAARPARADGPAPA